MILWDFKRVRNLLYASDSLQNVNTPEWERRFELFGRSD